MEEFKICYQENPAERKKKKRCKSPFDSLNEAASADEFDKKVFEFLRKAKEIRDLASELRV